MTMNSNYNIHIKTRMSTIIYKIILLHFLVLVPSCSYFEDVLDKKPLDLYSDAIVWQDETLITMFVSNT